MKKKTIKKQKIPATPTIEEQQQLLDIYNQGLFVEAVAGAEKFIARFPEHEFGWKILGEGLQNLGRTNDALIVKRKVVELVPNDAEAHSNLGVTLKESGLLDEAENSYRRALKLNPKFAIALGNLGAVFKEQKQIKAAEESYRQALTINPNFPNALSNLANLLFLEKRYEEADSAYQHSLRHPQNKSDFDNSIFTRRNLCLWNEMEENLEKLKVYFEASNFYTCNPFVLLSFANFNGFDSKKSNHLFVNKVYKNQLAKTPLTTKITHSHQKLRIGYLSADFYSHATVYLMAGVLENRNTEAFDVYLYSYGIEAQDTSRSRVEKACEVFRNICELSDDEAAQQILADEIDVLVDLKGHTQGERLGIQALRPAPIVVSWLGYPATLGHERLADYIIGDATVTPLEHAEHFSETLALMPHCYQPNDNTRPIGACPTRAEAGLPENAFVFATFNQAYKISPKMFDIWCRLLAAVPNSVLWILEPIEVAQENLRREMTARGVEPSRLIFAPKMEQTEHLGRLQLVDLAVDTFPYTSHTTASDALWAGVPLVTKMGETFASRVAASILRTMDLAELVTDNDEDYFNVALSLAQNSEKLAALKQKISTQKNTSPLFDTQKFACDLERFYQTIWAQELKGERKAVVLTNELTTEIRTMNQTLADILQLERLTEVVDIGANPIDGEPPYKPMLSAKLCRVTGFEPQESALTELLTKKSELESYLSYAVGDGETHTLKICRASGMTSLFEPDTTTLDLFAVLKPCGEVVQRIEMQTRKLDDITEIERLDFLKIDIQGAELAVFQNGVQKLANAVVIQTEVSFVTLYENQPAMGEIDIELRRQGFIPHCFAAVKKWMIAPCVINNNPRQPLNQLLEADIVYVRDFSKPDLMTNEQLKQLAMIVHHCYGSFDLALRCILILEQRNVLPIGSQQQYLNLLAKKPTI